MLTYQIVLRQNQDNLQRFFSYTEHYGQQRELQVSVKAVKGAKAYVHEYTTEDGLAVNDWQTSITSQATIIFRGLEPGKKYYCRVAAVGSKGQLVYSDPIARIVI